MKKQPIKTGTGTGIGSNRPIALVYNANGVLVATYLN